MGEVKFSKFWEACWHCSVVLSQQVCRKRYVRASLIYVFFPRKFNNLCWFNKKKTGITLSLKIGVPPLQLTTTVIIYK